jgi:hypothetical protein
LAIGIAVVVGAGTAPGLAINALARARTLDDDPSDPV